MLGRSPDNSISSIPIAKHVRVPGGSEPGAQIFDTARFGARGGPTADLQINDLRDRCGRAEKAGKGRVAIDQILQHILVQEN